MQTSKQYLAPATASAHEYRRTGAIAKRTLRFVAIYIALVIGAILFIGPFLWMLSSSFKTLAEVQTWPVVWIPSKVIWQNYPDIFAKTPFARFLLNSVIIATGGIIGTIVGSSLAGFGFARMRFPGRDA